MFTDEPRFVSWKVLLTHVLDPLRRSIGGPHATRRSELPADPWCRFANSHSATWNRPACLRPPSTGCPECAACGDGPDRQPARSVDPDRTHLKVTKDTNGPGQAACREPLTERRADAVSGICQHSRSEHRLGSRDQSRPARSLAWSVRAMLDRPPARFKRAGIAVQFSARKRRNATMTGTSPAKRFEPDPQCWQLAVSPRDEADRAVTNPNDRLLLNVVSLMTSTCILPLTSRRPEEESDDALHPRRHQRETVEPAIVAR